MSVPNRFTLLQGFFNANKDDYNFVRKEDCGKFTEDFLELLRESAGNEDFYHLRKYGSATQYNKHAIDVLAYDNREHKKDDETDIMEVDILGSAESVNANPTWQVRNTPYQEKDLMDLDEIGNGAVTDMVIYQPYQGDSSNSELKRILSFDYSRRPQGADWDVSVWAFRVQHSALMGPVSPSSGGRPLGLVAAIEKHRIEWCQALGVPVILVPIDWKAPS